MSQMFNPPHPGRMIAESLEFLHISAREFAKNLGVSPSSITRVIRGERPITSAMAIRLSAALPGPSPEVWLAMQADYDTWQARQFIDVSHINRYSCAERIESKLNQPEC